MTGAKPWRKISGRRPKPCPFCGGAAAVERSSYSGLCYVRCRNCRAHSPFRVWADEAVAAWNWRFGEGRRGDA